MEQKDITSALLSEKDTEKRNKMIDKLLDEKDAKALLKTTMGLICDGIPHSKPPFM